MFNRLGVIQYAVEAASADAMLEAAIEAGADNAESGEDGHEVTCAIEDFFAVRDALEARFGAPQSAKLEWRPTNSVVLDEDKAAGLLKLVDALEDNDDVQNVYANFDIPDDIAQRPRRLPPSPNPLPPAGEHNPKRARMRLVGIDPGLRFTGWGIVEARGNRLTHIADGVIGTDGDLAVPDRLKFLHEALTALFLQYSPHEAAVEETYVNRNGAATLKLGYARGVALLAPAMAGIVVAEYGAMEVKRAVVGTGAASKDQVEMMVRRLLPGATLKRADAADALAVAICHAHHRSTRLRIAGGTVMA